MGKKRVGIFGGTFDPPHLGHLLLAETMFEQFSLDEVLFIPSNEAPHKDRSDLTPATHRYAMVVAATLHNPAFSPSAVEVNRPGKSYSIETVRLLEAQLGIDTEMFLVAGLDSFLAIQSWRSYEELLDFCHFIVVARPGNSFEQVREVLPDRFHSRVIDVRGMHEGGPLQLEADAGSQADLPWKIFLSDAVYLDVSATEIRARARTGRSIRYRVTPEVAHYIDTHGLYKESVVLEGATT